MHEIAEFSFSAANTRLLKRLDDLHEILSQHSFTTRIVIKGLKKSSVVTSSGASTRIEGAVLTNQGVNELVKKGCRINKLSSRSEREVAGYVKALNYIYDNFQHLDINQKTIRELHQLLTFKLQNSDLPPHQRGAYKNITNDVVETTDDPSAPAKLWFKTTPPGPATQTAMSNLVRDYQKLKSTLHPLILTAGFIVHFLAIHPFRDGNGRLSRLLTTLLLLRHGYEWLQYTSHEKFIEDNKELYYTSLRGTQKTLSAKKIRYNGWVLFFFQSILSQAQFLHHTLIDLPLQGLNKNEKKVRQVIADAQPCSIAHILQHVGMSRDGLKSLLRRLVKRKIIVQNGITKGATYSTHP